MSPRRSPLQFGQYHAAYEHRPYRGGELHVHEDDYVEPKVQRSTGAIPRKKEGDECKQKIADLHASSQTIVDRYTKKLDAKCERLLVDEIAQKKADILIRKNQHLEQFKDQLKDHIKDQQTLCEMEARLQAAKDSLDNLIQRGAQSSVDNVQIIKLKNDVQSLEQDVSALKAKIVAHEAKITEQDPNLSVGPSGSACCIM